MFRELPRNKSYKSLMAFCSITFLLLAFATVTISYFFIPFGAAVLAAMFIFERPNKRILSFVLPTATIALSFFISPEDGLSVLFITIIALIISLCYARRKTKSECCLYTCAFSFLYLLVIFYFFSAHTAGTLNFDAVLSQMHVTVENAKASTVSEIIKGLNEIASEAENSISATEVENVVNSVFDLWPTLIFFVSFLISGVSIKFFSFLVIRNCKYGILKSFATFIPSTLVAYFYAVVAVISLFAYGSDPITLSITNISNSLMFVFAYMGFKYFQAFSYAFRRRWLVYLILAAIVLLIPSVGALILSFFGIYVTVIANKNIDFTNQDE